MRLKRQILTGQIYQIYGAFRFRFLNSFWKCISIDLFNGSSYFTFLYLNWICEMSQSLYKVCHFFHSIKINPNFNPTSILWRILIVVSKWFFNKTFKTNQRCFISSYKFLVWQDFCLQPLWIMTQIFFRSMPKVRKNQCHSFQKDSTGFWKGSTPILIWFRWTFSAKSIPSIK